MLVIHPGFEKTGTTTLQEAVFGPHPQILNLGRPVQPLGKQFGSLLRTPDGKFVTVENWLEYSWKNWITSFLGLCDYRQTITLYRDLFGEDCINILLFEELRDDLPSFASSLANILLMDKAIILDMLTGTVANARDPARSVIYSRWREKLLPQTSLTKILPFGPKLRNQFHQILNRGRAFRELYQIPGSNG